MPRQESVRRALTARGRASAEQRNKEKKETVGGGGGGGSGCTLLCPSGLTDVRGNVWVVRSLHRVPVEPHQWEAHPYTSLHRKPSTGRRG